MEAMVLHLAAEDPREWSEEDYSFPQSTTWRISNLNQLHPYHKQYEQVCSHASIELQKLVLHDCICTKIWWTHFLNFHHAQRLGILRQRGFTVQIYTRLRSFFATTSVVEVADCNTSCCEPVRDCNPMRWNPYQQKSA
ncbi:hypothetical protein AVEN_114122-1 [Araneus ventricosus]|uniref:Uncharacterized protein n=1 Tax=Araneus ventricosus TaxID=182803 RepID=A0A4Y2Q6Y1_ARAVE|nr:hypothetical protein AVEN_114122-1 [Araneus ventricosus]